MPTRVFERLRGLYTPVVDIRRRVFVEVARLAFKESATQDDVEAIPFKIIAGQVPHYRCCVFRERAIVRERVRLACGFDLHEGGEHEPVMPAIADALSGDRLIADPLVNVIKIGCEKCPEDSIVVTDLCRNCMAHPCVLSCPVNAISIAGDRARVDDAKCIKCMRCTLVCPYEAITRRGRPCAQACGVNAVVSDADGFAEIDQEKCVACGLCIVSCPFGAIADKSEILQVAKALRDRGNVHAIVAPSFTSQFGPKVSPSAIFEGIRKLGFASVSEVAYGADIDVIIEAEKLAAIVKGETKQAFLGTSCCPSWVMAARAAFPDLAGNISDSFTPMVETAMKVKAKHPGCKVVFVGPCIAKKKESMLEPMRSHVDHVITFEELAAMLVAMKIDLADIGAAPPVMDATRHGRGYAVAGGVCKAIEAHARDCHALPPFETRRADTLKDCLAMLKDIKQGTSRPVLIEGMACPDGCIGGPGTLAPIKQARRAVDRFAADAARERPSCDDTGGNRAA